MDLSQSSAATEKWKRGIHLATEDNTLYGMYHRNRGFGALDNSVANRYFAIETRVHETFRFVEPAPENASTYSYEYASLLMDIGSTFDSALKVFGRNVTGIEDPRIGHHLDFLKKNLRPHEVGEPADLTAISVELASSRTDRFLYPFADVKPNSKNTPRWWTAYNHVKHREIEKFGEGNLKNVLNALAALFVLFISTDGDNGKGYPYKVLIDVKFDQRPMEWEESLWFFKS